MPRKIKQLTNRLFHRPKVSQSDQVKPLAEVPSPVAPESPSVCEASKETPENPPPPEDLWQSAYDRLGPKEQRVLSATTMPTQAETMSNEKSPTAAIIDQVIQTTEEQYEKYQSKTLKIRRAGGEDIDLRNFSHKMINAALSFKHVVDAVVSLDPTGHAASAWTVVSLGLTIGKNRIDLRDALFDSSEYLADVLARHVYIEKNFYHSGGQKVEIGQALVKVYAAILRYTAEVLESQNSGIGKWMLESVTEIGDQHLTGLKACVEEEKLNLHQWVQLDQHLQHGKQAENILGKIDKMTESLQSLIKNFGLPIAEGASFDSYMNQHEDICLPETRIELRSQISEWAESSDSRCIFWVKGMAGTGKSTVARTVAQSFSEKGILGASFFFKKGETDRGTARRLIPTVAKQLINRNHQLAAGVIEAIQNDPDISSKALSQQFEKILLQPLINLRLDEPTTMVVVIDALDECEDDEDIRVLLQLLPQVQKSSSLQLRVFLTSRPELPMRIGFQQVQDHEDLELHELPLSLIERDIRLFLQDRLGKIQQGHLLSPDWPGEDVLNILVSKSVPLFIFAATLCRFIGEKYQEPEDRLDAFLKGSESTSGSPMERMYQSLLNELLKEAEISNFTKELQDVVGVIVLLAAPLSVRTLARLIDFPERRTRSRLAPFHSVLRVPDDCDGPVSTLHSSFREFLLSTTGAFHVDEKEAHRKIALHCLRVMKSGLKDNICGLSSYGTRRADIDGQIISRCLPEQLQYACRYWIYHFERSKGQEAEAEVLSFLRNHFLHWLEAMSLLGLTSGVVNMINTLQSITGSNQCAELSLFLQDAKLFVLKNFYICTDFPLQLYCSGLAFLPTSSIIQNAFQASQRWVKFLPQVDSSWSAELQDLEGFSELAQSTFASSSKDNTIKGWDNSTSIVSVDLSPDGQIVASGSKDNKIRLWDSKTGQQLRTLEGHSNSAVSVAFSPDGQIVASGSYDNTIKLWDTKSYQQLRTLEGHSSSVVSVAFSPDGQMVASGSDDNTVKLWDTKTGQELRTMKGHVDWIQSVAFSPDGQLVASGSYDSTVKLWNTQTGEQLRTLEGHSGLVASVAFSPDGQTVASGSYDNTIKLWDVTSSRLRTLEGHSSLVRSVAFAPDQRTVASGSYDNTIKLWDIETCQQLLTLEGHSSPVRSVVFSPDGQMIVSGSYDNTIRFWDTHTGKQLRILEGQSGPVRPVAEGRTVTLNSPLSVENDWVTLAAEKVLWLPFDYRQFSICVAKGRILALAYPDGRVCVMEFDAPTG
ncbi:hypothetical protein FE257_002421 [Aspergillus nanangensis]|uniref:NACHT domain-containing protein n=1 Tax=Aspergillus nanangensis TaxID=2582783 RepID=A0AAD4CCJ6_ASPNN|nr:hypothetical protein FE257_002421 [Aspergillus nanangensis]